MRVLYVEDNPTNVFLVKRVAKLGQHDIINYVDGGEALRKYDDIDPDLVLMDVQLSGELSGLDVVRQLRARGVDTPIIAVTAYAMVGDKERCIEAGCTDYLAKPLPVPRLVEIFQEYSDAAEAKKASAARSAEPANIDNVSSDSTTVDTKADDIAENNDATSVDVSTTEAPAEASTETKTNDDTETAPTASSKTIDKDDEAVDNKTDVSANAAIAEPTTDTEKQAEPTVATSTPDTTEVSDKS